MNSFVTVVLCCPLCQIPFYLCHTFLNLGRSKFYTSRLPKGLYRSESITSTVAFSIHLSHSYVLVQVPLLFVHHALCTCSIRNKNLRRTLLSRLSTQSAAITKHSCTYLYAVIISKMMACKQKYNIDIQLRCMPPIKVGL